MRREVAEDLSGALQWLGRASRRRYAFERAAHRVARSLGPLVSVLNPNLIVIGGEVDWTGYDVVDSPLLRALKRHTMRPALRCLEVLGATLERRTTLQGGSRRSSGRREMIDALLSFP